MVSTSKNRMRIICNPFRKEIEYEWYDSNLKRFEGLNPQSKLAKDEFVRTTIQNRAHEIVSIVSEELNPGNVGLEIVFIGTQDDYSDFCDVITKYYGRSNISCVRDNYCYQTADIVMPKIKDKFSEIKSTLDEYSEDGIKKLVDKYTDAVKPSISLCITGLYSAGKSAFINSIIGAEILPSASDPTTAKVCKICHDSKYQIRFSYDGTKCVLDFEGSSYKTNCNLGKEIIKKLQTIVDDDKKHDEATHMNSALKVLNTYSSNVHKLSEMIEIYVPFVRTALPVKEFDFVIYDTPGSNSANNARHFEVLEESLDRQTNALPIFLATPDSMDAKDNEGLLSLIEKTNALDKTNAIVIINKADDKSEKTLAGKREKCKDLKITKWKSTCIFFVSSAIAMASNKENPDNPDEWMDEDLFENYEKNASKYASDERKLFEFNIVDKGKADDAADYADSDRKTHLYKNSGLEAVEKEIVGYASRYALYNKCQQASSYLQEAIDLCIENVKEAEKKYALALDEANRRFDAKQRELCDKLEVRKICLQRYNTEFQESTETIYKKFTTENKLSDSTKGELRQEMQTKWNELQKTEKNEKKEKNWASSQMQQYVEQEFNKSLQSFSSMANAHIQSFWSSKSDVFRYDCLHIVQGSRSLTDEQKKILEACVRSKGNMSIRKMEFNLRTMGALKNKRFLFWKLQSEKFDCKQCCDEFQKQFNDTVRSHSTSTISNNEKQFERWTDELTKRLKEELCAFNSNLHSIHQQIVGLRQDLAIRQRCGQMLTESKKYIDNLLDYKGGENDG